MDLRVGYVFDLDDTLILERDYVRSGFAAAGEWMRGELGVEGFSETAWELFLAGRRGTIFDEALRALGLGRPAGLIARLVAVYRGHLPQIQLQPDVERFLARHAGVPMAIISDGAAMSHTRKLEALGLAAWFEPIVCTDLWGSEYWKPHPRAFELVERAWGLPRENYVFVGDNPAKDFGAPLDRGWRVARLRRPLGLHRAMETPRELGLIPEIATLDDLDASLGFAPVDFAGSEARGRLGLPESSSGGETSACVCNP